MTEQHIELKLHYIDINGNGYPVNVIEAKLMLEKIKRLEKELERRTNLLRSCYGFVADADRVGIITAEIESILEGRDG